MKPKYKLIKEEQTVNEVQLQDLYTSASNVEKQVISLADMAIKFSNNNVRRMALALKSRAQEFTSTLSTILVGAEEGLEGDTGDKKMLDQNKDAKIIESMSVKESYTLRKKLGLSESVFNNLKKTGKILEVAKFIKEAEEIEDSEETTENTEVEMPVETAADETEENKEVKEESGVIELNQAYNSIIDGLDEDKFNMFRDMVVTALENSIDMVEGKTGAEGANAYTGLIDRIRETVNPEDYETVMNDLYDFADENSIEINISESAL